MSEERFKILIEKGIDDIIDDEFKKYMHEEFYKLMFPYIPYDTGALASTTDYELNLFNIKLSEEQSMNIGLTSGNIDTEGITFNAPYAEDAYYNQQNWHKDKHPLATSEWGQVAFNAHEQELVNTLQEYLNRRVIEI